MDSNKKIGKKEEGEMTFLEHLEELRWHLIRSLIAIVVFAIGIFVAKDFVFNTVIFGPKNADFFSYSFMCKLSEAIGLGQRMCYAPPEFTVIGVGFGELFITHIKVSLVLGFVLAFPYIFWEFWRFIKPGLYEKEKNLARGTVGICSILFIMGILFGYYVIAPFGVRWLAGYDLPGAMSQPTVSSYVNYMVMFTLPAGIIFELPVFVYIFTKLGLINSEIMRKYRKHSIIAILLLSALITPPDVITQFLIGIPLLVLYEVGIFISARITKQEEAKEQT